MEEEQKQKTVELKANIRAKSSTSRPVLVVKATPVKGDPQTLVFEESTSSEQITQSSSGYLGHLAPAYKEVITETVQRSKWLGAGFKFGFEFPKVGKLEFEKKPAKEVKKIEKVIWIPPIK